MSDEQSSETYSKLPGVLRCPVAVQNKDSDDPGKLELVREYWLVCAESGYKYPIIDGIPWMLAFALRNDGWYLRSDIIWHKRCPMGWHR